MLDRYDGVLSTHKEEHDSHKDRHKSVVEMLRQVDERNRAAMKEVDGKVTATVGGQMDFVKHALKEQGRVGTELNERMNAHITKLKESLDTTRESLWDSFNGMI